MVNNKKPNRSSKLKRKTEFRLEHFGSCYLDPWFLGK